MEQKKGFFRWFAGFFEDQAGSASSKRATLYAALGMLGMIVRKSLIGGVVNEYVLYCVIVIILASLGVVTSEWFKDKTMTIK